MKALMPNIGLSDLDLFLRVAKLRSLRECARQLGMTPGAVSKAIRRLEEKLGKNLLRRSASGIRLTVEGHELMTVAEKVLVLTAALGPEAGRRPRAEKVWSIGSLSFLSSRLLPPLLDSVVEARGGRSRPRFRLVEFGQNQLVAQGLNGAFELAVHIGPLEWTRVWSTHEIGPMRWKLYANARHPLTRLKKVQSADVVEHPFVMPTGWSPQGFVRGEDHCPVPWGARFAGHEATTAETALEIVAATSQLAFVPEILAQRGVDHGLLREVPVEDWPAVERKIYLSVRDDLVSSALLKTVTGLLRERLRS